MGGSIPNLWPTDLAPTVERTPLTILKEQAAQLGAQTKNLLEGRVDTMMLPDSRQAGPVVFRHAFSIIAPLLGDYRYELLVVAHKLESYPLTAHFYGRPSGKPEGKELASEAEFIDYLREVFASAETRRIIGTLLAQVQS
jgi:hypothetical protein